MKRSNGIYLLAVAIAPASAFAQAYDPIGATAAPPPQVASADDAGPQDQPGSPSNATTTVSASAVPQNMERPGDPQARFDLSIGSIYASGDFGAARNTSIWSTALGARFGTGGLRLTASLPYLRIRSSGTVFTGIDSTPVVAAADGRPRRTADGFGDLTLGTAYAVTTPGTDTEVELSGRVKLPTASDSSGLSTGQTDYSLGLQATQPVGRLAPFASVTYRFLGDTAGWHLHDGFAASAGTSLLVGRSSLVLVSYHFAEAATRFVPDSHELFAGASTLFGPHRLRATGFVTAGLSRGAAGVSVGAAVSRAF